MSDIKLCSVCNGEGTETGECTNYHKREYETITCKQCNGTGRVITHEYSYTIPYNADCNYLSESYKVDSELVRMMREVEELYKNK